MRRDPYARLARHYDLLMADLPYRRWISFIAAFARKIGPAPLIADAGCGTGTVALGLMQRGYSVLGWDRSPEMLARAAYKAREMGLSLPLWQGELASLPPRADLVISTCDGLNHLLSSGQVVDFFIRVRDCLAPGGGLLFDINSEYRYRRLLGSRVFSWERAGLDLVWRNRYVPPFNIADVDLYWRKEGDSWAKTSLTIRQRCYSLSSLVYYLEQAGFRLEGVWEDYRTRAIAPDTRRLTLAARKA